jgi:hypothetical protein
MGALQTSWSTWHDHHDGGLTVARGRIKDWTHRGSLGISPFALFQVSSLACALLLGFPVWMADADFFSKRVVTWTAPVELYLAPDEPTTSAIRRPGTRRSAILIGSTCAAASGQGCA